MEIKHRDARVYSPAQVLFPEISHQTVTYPGAGPILT